MSGLEKNTMIDLTQNEIWFITGSQHLYGPETLKQVADNAKTISRSLHRCNSIPTKVVCKPTLKTPGEVTDMMIKANTHPQCVGLVCWMHTFSPAKMWIAGLNLLTKPFMHLHTQFNRDIPWDAIDMDFMNLNQSAHGGREFGFMASRLRIERKVVVGHWQEKDVQAKIGQWARVASAWADCQGMRVCRWGDNMRDVAVTEGDKVEAQKQLGWAVYGYGIGDLAARVKAVTEKQISGLVKEYEATYRIAQKLSGSRAKSLRESARIELGMKNFLAEGNFKAFTTTFEDLHGLTQLPGLAVQRLMESGYGFGAEGDWKTAALVRAMKVMASGLPGGTSFMEDYTYHLDPAGPKVLGAHMLEVCASIAADMPSLEIHPLGIGGKADPCRLVFNVPAGPGLNASLVDMGNRFRLVVNEVDVVAPDADLPKLPVARVVWVPKPDLATGAAAWIHAGGAHHTGFSMAIDAVYLEDFAAMAGVEYLHIGDTTAMREFKQELRWNEVYYMLAHGLK